MRPGSEFHDLIYNPEGGQDSSEVLAGISLVSRRHRDDPLAPGRARGQRIDDGFETARAVVRTEKHAETQVDRDGSGSCEQEEVIA